MGRAVGLRSLKAKDPGLFTLRTDEFHNLDGPARRHGGDAWTPDKFLLLLVYAALRAPVGRQRPARGVPPLVYENGC